MQISGNDRNKKSVEDEPNSRQAKKISDGRRRKVSAEQKSATAAPGGRTLVPPKEVDVKASLDALTFQSGAKMRNITCVMQELGYLDENLEPSYEKMMERITKLQVSMDLKKDMLDGVRFCKQFSVSGYTEKSSVNDLVVVS